MRRRRLSRDGALRGGYFLRDDAVSYTIKLFIFSGIHESTGKLVDSCGGYSFSDIRSISLYSSLSSVGPRKNDRIEDAVLLAHQQAPHALSKLGELRIGHQRSATHFAIGQTLITP